MGRRNRDLIQHCKKETGVKQMNKEQYAAVLERQIRRKCEEDRKKSMETKTYKDIDKEITKLEKKLKTLRDKRNKLINTLSYQERHDKIQAFRAEWDEMSLILDTKKRNKAKEAILKKYKLYR